jgi:hypothetical protein
VWGGGGVTSACRLQHPFLQELKLTMKARETDAYASQMGDEEVGDRGLRGKGLRLKKLASVELVSLFQV